MKKVKSKPRRKLRSERGGSARRTEPSRKIRLQSPTHESHFLLGRSIPDLNLVVYAAAAAERLLAQFPGVIFTSGRRDAKQQAAAMAGNIVQNRKWIQQTYVASAERDSLQAWLDSHPDAVSAASIALGLLRVMEPWTDDQKKNLSRHFSGQAFDVQPVAGQMASSMKAAIRALPNLRKFLDKEGGLVIWHADFEVT